MCMCVPLCVYVHQVHADASIIEKGGSPVPGSSNIPDLSSSN